MKSSFNARGSQSPTLPVHGNVTPASTTKDIDPAPSEKNPDVKPIPPFKPPATSAQWVALEEARRSVINILDASKGDMAGCDASEIKAINGLMNGAAPAAYLAFMEKAGRKLDINGSPVFDPVFVHYDSGKIRNDMSRTPNFPEMANPKAYDHLRKEGFIPPKAFVFGAEESQYLYFFILGNDHPDPKVYCHDIGGSAPFKAFKDIKREYASFSAFVKERIDASKM